MAKHFRPAKAGIGNSQILAVRRGLSRQTGTCRPEYLSRGIGAASERGILLMKAPAFSGPLEVILSCCDAKQAIMPIPLQHCQ